jgi:hypothetical protein
VKTGKMSKSLGIDPKTITDWVTREEFKDFFSLGAKLEAGKAQRDFNMDDQVLLNTIRELRNEQGEKDWEKIASEIRNGHRATKMPDSFYTTETTTSMQVYTQMIEIKNQLDLITIDRDQLRVDLEKEREARRTSESELNREIGKLLGKLETLQEQLDDED